MNTYNNFKDLHPLLSCQIWASLFPKEILVQDIFGITLFFPLCFCSKYFSYFESYTDQEIIAHIFPY